MNRSNRTTAAACTAALAVGLALVPAGARAASGPIRGIRIAATANLNELVPVTVRFTASAPSTPVPVVVQVAHGRSWRRLARATFTPHPPGTGGLDVRLTTAGRLGVRVVFGPRLRRHTAAVTVRVVRPWFTRVVAGGRAQQAVVDDANVLWVLSTPVVGSAWELRALNGSTGRRLAGPVPVATASRVITAGGSAWLLQGDGSALRLDRTVPGLTVPGAALSQNVSGCQDTCVPDAVVLADDGTLPLSTGIGLTAAGPDGRVWALNPSGLYDPAATATVVEYPASGTGPGTDHGSIGVMRSEQARAVIAAVTGGAWVLNVDGVVWWVPSGTGEPTSRDGGYLLAVRGERAWALDTDALVPLRTVGAEPDPIQLAPFNLDVASITATSLAVGTTVAWLTDPTRGTLVRVPLNGAHAR